jgi:hypothetical protein
LTSAVGAGYWLCGARQTARFFGRKMIANPNNFRALAVHSYDELEEVYEDVFLYYYYPHVLYGIDDINDIDEVWDLD